MMSQQIALFDHVEDIGVDVTGGAANRAGVTPAKTSNFNSGRSRSKSAHQSGKV